MKDLKVHIDPGNTPTSDFFRAFSHILHLRLDFAQLSCITPTPIKLIYKKQNIIATETPLSADKELEMKILAVYEEWKEQKMY